MPNPRRSLLAALTVFTAAAVAVTLLVTGGNGDGTGTGDPAARPPAPTGAGPTSAWATPPPPPPPPPPERVVVVKIDNVEAARPQSGLDAADVVYVEPVEGGFTRLAAVYSSRLPEVAGPVRSARESDVELLAQYGRPALVFSGAAPEIEPVLARSAAILVRPDDAPAAFFRDPTRSAPHNLYVHPAEVPQGSGPGPRQVFRFGPAPPGGTPTAEHTVSYPQATYRMVWSPEAGRWLIRMDGMPIESIGAGTVTAATVVVQRVPVGPGVGVTDAAGSVSPVVRTVGSGPATVLRDGKAYRGTWSRPSAERGTHFTTGDGRPVPLADGPVWVLLVPA